MALLLRRRGILKVRPLEGGLESWRQLGFPMGTAALGETLSRGGAESVEATSTGEA